MADWFHRFASPPQGHIDLTTGSRPRLHGAAGWIIAGAVFASLPLVLGESYLFLTIDFLVMALFALSFNLLLGHAGMLSFGHATFYGLGAYAVAVLQNKLGVPIWLGLAAAPVVAAIAAWAIGWFCVRLTGMHFAMLTLAFSQLVYTVVLSQYHFTGGEDGMPAVLPDWLGAAAHYYYFCLGVVAACIALIRCVTRSPFGMALGAIRENRQRAAYIGLDVRQYELRVFVVAGAFAGVAGGLRAGLQGMAFPSLMSWSHSADPILMSLAGGIHAFAGPIVGAALFVFTNFAVTSHFQYPLLVFGLLVLVIVMFLPEGIVGSFARWRMARRQHAAPARPTGDAPELERTRA